MQAQLYRFRIESEVAPGRFAAVDEADQSQVWLVAAESYREQLAAHRPQLERIALDRECEYFTAGTRLYFVATLEAQSRELRASIAALGLGPVEAIPPPVLKPEAQANPRTAIWIFGSALALVAAVALIAALWPKSSAAAPEFVMAGTSLAIRDSTPGAIIHYTVDGSTPTEYSSTYDRPLAGLRNGAVVQAVAIAPDHAPSSASQYTYAPPTWLVAYGKAKEYLKTGRFAQARNALRIACQGEALDACNDLAKLYYYGKGGPVEVGKARETLGDACDRGNIDSCASAGRLYQLDGNSAEAGKYFQKACAGGVQIACNQLREAR